MKRVLFVFSSPNLEKQNIPKSYPELEIEISHSKKQIQISSSGQFFGIFSFQIWRLKKRIALSEKKPPLEIMKQISTGRNLIKMHLCNGEARGRISGLNCPDLKSPCSLNRATSILHKPPTRIVEALDILEEKKRNKIYVQRTVKLPQISRKVFLTFVTHKFGLLRKTPMYLLKDSKFQKEFLVYRLDQKIQQNFFKHFGPDL